MNGPVSKSTISTPNKFITNPKTYLKMPRQRHSVIDEASSDFIDKDKTLNMGFEKKSP